MSWLKLFAIFPCMHDWNALNWRSSNKDGEIMKTPRESIAIGDIPTDTDAKYPTVVNTNSARAQLAVNGMDRLQDTADHNRWKNAALQSGLDLFQS